MHGLIDNKFWKFRTVVLCAIETTHPSETTVYFDEAVWRSVRHEMHSIVFWQKAAKPLHVFLKVS
jgi:hypothetical protein